MAYVIIIFETNSKFCNLQPLPSDSLECNNLLYGLKIWRIIKADIYDL